MRTRREFLTATTGLLAGTAVSQNVLNLTPLSAAETAKSVKFTPDIEPIVQLIEETPREKCFEVMAEQLSGGLPYRQFLTALYLAGIRNVNPQPPGFKFHCVFVIHAAHQLSLNAAAGDRLLPLFWALDNFKVSQQKDVAEGDFRLPPVPDRKPFGESAWREFHEAMDDWDAEKADQAIAVLARTFGAHRVIDEMWPILR